MRAIELVPEDDLINALRRGEWPPVTMLSGHCSDRRPGGDIYDESGPEGTLPLSRVHSRRKSGLPRRIRMDPRDDGVDQCGDYDDNNDNSVGGVTAHDDQRGGAGGAGVQGLEADHKEGEPHARRRDAEHEENEEDTEDEEEDDDEDEEGDEVTEREDDSHGSAQVDDNYVVEKRQELDADAAAATAAVERRNESHANHCGGDVFKALKPSRPRSKTTRRRASSIPDVAIASPSSEAQGEPRLSVPAGMERLLSKCNS